MDDAVVQSPHPPCSRGGEPVFGRFLHPNSLIPEQGAFMVDLSWWITFFFLMTVVMLILKLLTGSTWPAEAVVVPLILLIGTIFISRRK